MQAHDDYGHEDLPHHLPMREAGGRRPRPAPQPEEKASPEPPPGPEAGPLVRPYVIAQGRDHADTVKLDMISVVIAAKRAEVDEK